jgi:hypothetical protein
MDSDPIKQLQGLLDDPGKVLEKISSIHSALDSIKTNLPQSAGVETIVGQAAQRPGALPDDPVFGRLLQALRDMQAQIEERIQPIAQEMVRYEVARLRDQSDEHQSALKECLAQIDQNILNCLARMDEYQRRCADLSALNLRLADLGAVPEPLSPTIAIDNAADSIVARLDGLRLTGKI